MASETQFPPGTMVLNEGSTGSIVYQPQPTDDPEDPLNWSKLRKVVNFAMVLSYVLFTFVLLDVAPVAYGGLVEDLGFTYQLSTIATALNFAGLAIGCILFIPFTYRYGRRPIYIISVAIQLAGAIFAAVVQDNAQLLGSSFVMGLGGAISETIVQITIVDLFFVHQYATTNGLFLFTQGTGAYLGPVAAGYVVVPQGWRWMWWWCAIFLAATLVLVLLLFEESTFNPPPRNITQDITSNRKSSLPKEPRQPEDHFDDIEGAATSAKLESRLFKTVSQPLRNRKKSSKPLKDRLALVTHTDVSIRNHFLAPFQVLFTFPAVAYTAVTFGSILSWFAVIISIASTNMIYPPYNFTPSQIGLINLAPFVGQLIGALVIAPQSDRWIVRLAKRNGGLYEPEMRLWPALPGGVLVSGGIFMFGIGIAHSAHWAILAVGIGIYAVGFNICLDISLAYLADCYPDIVGDALTAVVFVRNALAVVVSFCLSPWLEGMGLQSMFILIGCVAFVLLLIPVPLLIWGKRARIMTTERYARHCRKQPARRA